MRTFLIVALFVSSTFIAAAPPHARAAAGGNPCALLSLGEAQSITHFSLKNAQPNPLRAEGGADKDTSCTYMNDETNQGVVVTLHDDAAYFPGNAKDRNTEGYRAVKGIGDRAWTNGLAMAVAVDILKHGKYVHVGVMDPNGLKDRGKHNTESAMAIAKLVASRM